MKTLFILSACLLFSACNSDSSLNENNDNATAANTLLSNTKTSDIRPKTRTTTYNPEAVIPPQCYTKHEANYNPCITCHQSYPFLSRPNAMNDLGLQMEYAFSDPGLTNHWKNLFEDRRERISQIGDNEILNYINTDNYSPLIRQLKDMADWQGPIPELNNLALGKGAFDNLGFAKDGSHWVAFNYKPLPSTFWPTNGSTDDVMIRLPQAFRASACTDTNNRDDNAYSQDAYLANLAILEMAIKDLSTISTPPINEKLLCQDLNQNGILEQHITEIPQQVTYAGGANHIPVNIMLYPQGTEFLHTVRYVGVDNNGNITVPARMKELRYMRKHQFLSAASLLSAYGNEQQEKTEGRLPKYDYREDRGISNNFGWTLMGFIEAKDGHLRMQDSEETLFCMGCHSTIGTTIDQTFAFARKITGANGWGYIDLKGMVDAPTMGSKQGEIAHYLATVGGGNEFRQNSEMTEKWFNADGTLRKNAVKNADVYTLITPSPARALSLNKAYLTIVHDQDYIYGRDANITPAINVHRAITSDTPVLDPSKVHTWDMRLDWSGEK